MGKCCLENYRTGNQALMTYCKDCGSILKKVDFKDIHNQIKDLENITFYFGRAASATKKISDVQISENIYSSYHFKIISNKFEDIKKEEVPAIKTFLISTFFHNNLLYLKYDIEISEQNAKDAMNLKCIIEVEVPDETSRLGNGKKWNRIPIKKEKVEISLKVVKAPVFALSPDEIDLGTIDANTPEVSEILRIYNRGGGILPVKVTSKLPSWLTVNLEPDGKFTDSLNNIKIGQQPLPFYVKIDTKCLAINKKMNLTPGKTINFEGALEVWDGFCSKATNIPVKGKLHMEQARYPLMSIDFGTINTKVAYKHGAEPRSYEFPDIYRKANDGTLIGEGSFNIPSKIYIDFNGKCYIGEPAQNKAIEDRKFFKRDRLNAIDNLKTLFFRTEPGEVILFLEGKMLSKDDLYQAKDIWKPYIFDFDGETLLYSYNENGRLIEKEISIKTDEDNIYFIFFGHIYKLEELAIKFLYNIFSNLIANAGNKKNKGSECFIDKSPVAVEMAASVPSFSGLHTYKNRLKSMLEALCFNAPVIIEESVAAGYYFAFSDDEIKPGDYVLMIDSGGGTTDFAFMRAKTDINPETGWFYKGFEIIASTNSTIAGNEFTNAILEYIWSQGYEEWTENSPFRKKEEREEFFSSAKKSIINDRTNREEFEKIKMELFKPENEKNGLKIDFKKEYSNQKFDYSGTIHNRDETLLRCLNKKVFELMKTFDCFISAIQDVINGKKDINYLWDFPISFHMQEQEIRQLSTGNQEIIKLLKTAYLSGGSSQFKPLKDAICSRISKDKLKTISNHDLYSCVSKGAIQYKFRPPYDVLMKNYGVIIGDKFEVLHSMYSPCPTTGRKHHVSNMPAQSVIMIGVHELSSDNQNYYNNVSVKEFASIEYRIGNTVSPTVSLELELFISKNRQLACKLKWAALGSDEYKELDEGNIFIHLL